MLHSIIMAGGSGTRFWPLSRQALPKQFLALGGDRSLIQQASDRCAPWIPAERSWVVTADRLAKLTQEHLPDLPACHLLQEPAPRNTAPCVALAAMCLLGEDPDATMLVMPADHIIADAGAFRRNVEQAVSFVEQDSQRLVLFGVPPTYPATGFGYIERGIPLTANAFQVAAFHEKPDRSTADRFLRAGTFFWNCGIFVWKARRILEAIATHEPEMMAHLEVLKPHYGHSTWGTVLADVFPKLKSISIDYAVLEREPEIIVVESGFPWDDVGGWEAARRISTTDDQGNSLSGQSIALDSRECIVQSADDHLVAAFGMENCIIIHTPDATLVARRGDDESIRKIIACLQARGLNKYL